MTIHLILRLHTHFVCVFGINFHSDITKNIWHKRIFLLFSWYWEKKFGIQTSKLSKVKLISFFHSTSSLSSIHLLLSNAIHRFKPKKGRRGWKNLPNLFADFVKFFSSMFLTLFQRLLACLPSLTLREGRSIEFQSVKLAKICNIKILVHNIKTDVFKGHIYPYLT